MIGLFSGLVLGVIIALILWASSELIGKSFDNDMVTLPLLLSMGFGSVIDSIFGSLTELKK